MLKKLKTDWLKLTRKYANDDALIEQLWQEILQQYSSKNRAYHNLSHLDNMFGELEKSVALIEDIDTLRFSIWYHDLIYNALKKDNELQSAIQAKFCLRKLGLESAQIERCYEQIILTKNHSPTATTPQDDKFLVDFDLEILSKDWVTYQKYSQQVRKEYWMYPSFMYKKGRAAAMQKFLEREQIYQTDFYQKEKEDQARANIKREIETLQAKK